MKAVKATLMRSRRPPVAPHSSSSSRICADLPRRYYRAIFLNNTPLMDARSPVEFEQGAFPTAVNIPLLSNEQRRQIGISYKEDGKEEAVKLGHLLISGGIKEQRLTAWKDFIDQYPNGALYCFRGGLRSKITQQWIYDEFKINYPRIGGGYKEMRSFLMAELESMSTSLNSFVIGGRTGVGKTNFLAQFENNFIDLEAAAHHRGSAFGTRVKEQPTQINFENLLTVWMMQKRKEDPRTLLLFEDESRTIGSVHLPIKFLEAFLSQKLIILEGELEDRVNTTLASYVLDSLNEYIEKHGEDNGFQMWKNYLLNSLFKIQKKLGMELYERLKIEMEGAFAIHADSGDVAAHRTWIEELLVKYYDPMYDYQLKNNNERGRVLFQGNEDAVKQFIQDKIKNKSK